MKCVMCGGATKRSVNPSARVDIDIELKGAKLMGVPRYTCQKCGEVYTELPPLEMLLDVFTRLVVANRDRLEGHEVRFLRKRLGYSSKDFAQYFMVSASTVSRWEHGGQAMDPFKEKMLRQLALGGPILDDYGPDIAPQDHPEGRKNEIYVVNFAEVEQAAATITAKPRTRRSGKAVG